MKNKRRIAGLAAALVLALVGTFSLVAYVQSARDEAVADEELVDVYVFDEFVPKGAEAETITSALSVEQVPARLVQDGAISELDEVGDQVAAGDLQPGDQLVAARLSTRDIVAEVVADKVQVSALLDAHRAVGGALSKGDLVGVYLSFEPFEFETAVVERTDATVDPIAAAVAAANAEAQAEAAADANAAVDSGTDDAGSDDDAASETKKTPNVTRLEFQNVLVTNVQTINAPVTVDQDGAPVEQVTGTQYVVTVALSPEESERFVFAAEFGSVWLSIDPSTVVDDGTRVVTLGDVYSEVER